MRNLNSLLLLFIFITGISLFSRGQSNIPTHAKKIQLNGKEFYIHVVEKGEGLYRISVNYGVSMSEILQANPDISQQLQLGQIVRVPVISGRNSDGEEMQQSREYVYHTVEKGQTAYFISRKYNLTLEQLYQFNPGIENGLILGSILKIPTDLESGKSVGSVPLVRKPTPSSEKKYIQHLVQPRETLYSISKQYFTTVEAIVEDNPALRNGILATGSEIRIAVDDPEKSSTDQGVVSEPVGEFITGDNYLYHMIEAGQTFYSISRQYLIDVSELRAANPDVDGSNLKVGYLLRIPRPTMNELDVNLAQQEENPRWFINHKVRKRETLFGISQTYHVDMDIVRKVNPTVNFSNLDRGIVLRIPKDEWFAARNMAALLESQKELQEDSIRTSLTYDECLLNHDMGYTRPLRVALLLPFSAPENVKYYAQKNDSTTNSRNISVTARRSRALVEFYSGALMALDSLKRMGIAVNFSVFDISPDSFAVKRALANPALIHSDLVIGPGLSHELDLVSDFSKKHAIPLVFPISNNTNHNLLTNPYLFQVNTPDSLLFDQMAEEIVEQSKGANLLVILPPNNEKDANLLVQRIKEHAVRQMYSDKSVNYIEYRPKSDDLVAIQALMSKDVANYVVIPSVAPAEISKIIPVLKGVKEKTRTEVNLFGRSEWLRMQTIDPEDIHYLNTTVFSSFRLDYENAMTQSFITKYRSWYNMEPHAISPYFQYSDATSGFSRFGIWGYDVTLYFISAMAQYGKNFDLCLSHVEHSEIQFDFDFKRISNWGGFYNRGLFKLQFTPNLRTVQKPLTKR